MCQRSHNVASRRRKMASRGLQPLAPVFRATLMWMDWFLGVTYKGSKRTLRYDTHEQYMYMLYIYTHRSHRIDQRCACIVSHCEQEMYWLAKKSTMGGLRKIRVANCDMMCSNPSIFDWNLRTTLRQSARSTAALIHQMAMAMLNPTTSVGSNLAMERMYVDAPVSTAKILKYFIESYCNLNQFFWIKLFGLIIF